MPEKYLADSANSWKVCFVTVAAGLESKFTEEKEDVWTNIKCSNDVNGFSSYNMIKGIHTHDVETNYYIYTV